MATLKDVARLACVDVSTVSRALNNTSYVHPETKKRILAAVKELSYQPNVLARGLREGKKNTLGIIIPRMYLTIFGEISQGIEEEARQRGYATIICNTEDQPSSEKECLNRLRNGFIDGLIVVGTGKNARLIRDIHSTGIACTQVIRQQDSMLNSVMVDYVKCGYEATKYLIRLGCKQIGLINGTDKFSPYRDRYQGYQKALKEHDLPETINSYPLDMNHNSLEYGYEATLELLEINPRLDAIMAAVDVQGIGAIRALKEKKLFPGKVKVISLTGHHIGSMLETTMTSMEMPAQEIGKQAAIITIDEIEKKELQQKYTPKHITLQSVLVEREST